MKFVDRVSVIVEAGNGGRGAVSFRHEKYVEKGGPDGGDGGKGGDVIFEVDKNLSSLQSFRYKQKLKASNGENGSMRKRHGKKGDDLIVKVPRGTVVVREGRTLFDLIEPEQREVVSKGGDGGYGNAHFKSSVRQAPRVAEKGEKGDKLEVDLELKLLADVGLVGLPNAGKSTFLSVISNAKPEIADYPFTTLTPNLGVVDVGRNSLLVADIPGLIEGASRGKGLGAEFLKHIERTSVLVHLIDVYCESVANSYKTIQNELINYKVDLSKKPQIVALTKTEGLTKSELKMPVSELKKVAPKGTKILAVSSFSKDGIKDLMNEVNKTVESVRLVQEKEQPSDEEDIKVYRLEGEDDSWQVTKVKKGYLISGVKIERFARRTDFENQYGVRRLRNIMSRLGIEHELIRSGIEPGDKILFSGVDDKLEF